MPDESPRSITRRRSLHLLGGGLFVAGSGGFGGVALRGIADGDAYVADAAAACTLTPEQEEGPYYVAVDTVRSHIVAGQQGLPFRLEVTVANSKTCKPVQHAAVDVWHCNAGGMYSDERSQGTSGRTWLRGVVFTDKHGLATFHTVYPGHYQGRTTHVHVKVHTGSADGDGRLTGGHVAHTGNLFSTDAVNAEVYNLSPYSSDHAAIVPRARDMVYRSQHGSAARMKVTRVGHRLGKGLVGRITLGVDPTASPAPIGIRS